MKKLLLLIAVLPLFFACDGNDPTPTPTPGGYQKPTRTEFPIKMGYNLGFWFGQGQGYKPDGEPYFGANKEKIEELVGYGFDHFRIPLDEEIMWREDGTFREEGLEALHNTLGWIKELGAVAIVDLHWLRVSNELPNEQAEADFKRCWKMLNEQLGEYPNEFLAYELLNEANGKNGYWNKFIANGIRMIRSFGQKNRIIVVGADNYQDYTGLEGLELPGGDPNLIVAFHYYQPMLLTHYKANWIDYNGPVHYPGRLITDEEWENELNDEWRERLDWAKNATFSKQDMVKDLKSAKASADKLGVRIHCGEFACSNRVGQETTIKWCEDMGSALREVGIPGCWWPFGLGESFTEDGSAHPAIIKALTGKNI